MGNTVATGDAALSTAAADKENFAAMKPIVIHSAGFPCVVQAGLHHSVADLRGLILEDFDADMLPSGEFYFEVAGVRLSQKQEVKFEHGICSGVKLF